MVADLRAELRAAWAIARKDLRVMRRYPLNTINVVLQPLYQFLIPSMLLGATFLVAGRAVGLEASAGTDDVAGFLFLGSVVGGLIGAAFWGVAFAFKTEMDAGTLEPAWLTPTRPETFVFGRALGSILVSSAAAAILLGVGVLIFGARFSPATMLAVPALAIAALSLLGIGYLVSSAVLLVKEPDFLVDSTDFAVIALSGVMFPIPVLPGALQVAAFLLPSTHALDLLRSMALGSRPLVPAAVAWAALIGLSIVTTVLGRWVFRRTEHRLRVRGTLGQH